MKNLAGHEASLFLFRFELHEPAISFVLNDAIAEDLYRDTGVQLQPLAHVCCETLARYRHQCRGEIIMDGHLLMDGSFEVMLAPGMGRHIAQTEKQALFKDAHAIARLLIDVMKRRDREREQNQPSAPSSGAIDFSPDMVSSGLEALGQRQHINVSSAPHLTPLSASDLPFGVVAKRSYDHRGYCMVFVHHSFGNVGRIVLFEEDGATMISSEVFNNDGAHLTQKTSLMEIITAIIEFRLNSNAGELCH